MADKHDERVRRLISEAEADIGFDRDDLPPSPMEIWLRLWWRTLRSTLPPPRT